MPIPNFVLTIEDQVVETVKSINETVAKVLPAPELPDLPFAERLPTPTAIVERAFATAGEVLENQKQFAVRLLEAATPASA
jgi:hypothetical protein